MMQKNTLRTKKTVLGGVVAVVSSLLVTVTISWLLYQHTVEILTANLKDGLLGVVKTAAVEFDAQDLNNLNDPEDVNTPLWSKIVNKLIDIRLSNDKIVFAYILRTNPKNSSKLDFVADSHSLNPRAKVDLDRNGLIDDADALNWPGEVYEDAPNEAFAGNEIPTTNRDLYTDQWGTLISGYAPIKDAKGNTAGIMTVDMRADNFKTLTRQTLAPFLAFIIALLGVILILAGTLIKIWTRQINLIQELDRQKDELLGIVSHQLASPITALKWDLEMVFDQEKASLSKEVKETMESMQFSLVNLADLVSMILDVSRIQLGRINIEKRELDLFTFFQEIVHEIDAKAKEKGVQFIKNIPASFPKAYLDKRYTHMTIENLLTNAVKYTPKGGKVEFSVTMKENGMLYAQVKDTGCGIPKKEQEKIFGKLFRASNVQNSVDGNGFGLYVAKGAIEAQGGKIWFESEEGKGSSFMVEIPIAASPKAPSKK